MIFIPGWMIALLTFPGVIVHEVAHRFFADLSETPVYEVCYFRIGGDPAGYVIHGPAKQLGDTFSICVGPLFLNTALCALITFSAVPVFTVHPASVHWVFLLLLWLGLSIGMHAFPSNQDMQNYVQAVQIETEGGALLWLARAFAAIFRLANALRVIWFDLLYALGVGMLLPWLLGVH